MMYKDLTYQIIGAAMEVHSKMGVGFQEVVYQRALALALNKRGIFNQREVEVFIYYDDINIGKRRIDFLVEEKILLEIKVARELDDIHLAQVINYLEVYQLPLALLISFGGERLIYRRVYPRKEQAEE